MWLASLAVVLARPGAATPVTAPTVQYSQDGRHWVNMALLDTTVSAARYYRYHGSAGHPAFGTVKNTATASVVWNTTDDSLALLFISGGVGDGPGNGVVTLTGVPRAARLTVADDAAEFHYSPRRGKLTGSFTYGGSTDGFVLGGLGGTSFLTRMSLTSRVNIDTFRLADGDPSAGGFFVPLNLKKPLYLRVTNSVTSSVPEPTGLLPGGLLAVSLIRRRAAKMPVRSR